MSWGAGSFRERTIASFIEEYENKITVQQVPKENKDIDVREIAQEIWEFLIAKSDDIFKKVPKEHRPRTGLAVCGYTKDNFFSEEYVMQIPTSKRRDLDLIKRKFQILVQIGLDKLMQLLDFIMVEMIEYLGYLRKVG
ncbi:hypothetical protein ES705_41697 [subsurface metagenome]